MRLTKIYTKVGDKGTTMLANGAKVSKNSPRIEAYGTVDELNANVAMLRDLLQSHGLTNPRIAGLLKSLAVIQNELFDVGGELATPAESLNIERQQVVQQAAIQRLEEEMDTFNQNLSPLENFVLPGGNLANSQSHIVRCVCRRAERCTVALMEVEKVRSEVLIYLNRLSDWMFVVSRLISKEFDVPEVLWAQRKSH